MRNLKLTFQTWLAAIAALGLSATLALADTFHSGNVSGTWTKAGNRHIVDGNCTVPAGQTLTIEPGVEVIIGQGLRIDVLGRILAEGSAAERITFRGANSALYWDRIQVTYGSAGDSSFVNCKFGDATNALRLVIDGTLVGSVSMNTPIWNCTFSNCQGAGISGYSHGHAGYRGGGGYGEYFANNPILSPKIVNCLFANLVNGCSFVADGEFYDVFGGTDFYARGAVSPAIENCVFKSITEKALTFGVGPYPANSYPQLVNNVFVQCTTAAQNDDRTVVNDVLAYNCFFLNQTNFIGYPAGVFGTICCVNAKGTNCDLANNIFENPLFAETVNYTLATNSPCIDAGNPAAAYLDTLFPPSQGTTVNDIGLYGGPLGGNSLTNAYNGTTNFMLTAKQWIGVTINPAGAGQYRLDYRNDLSTGIWTQATNVNLLSTPWTYIDWDSPGIDQRFYRAVKLP